MKKTLLSIVFAIGFMACIQAQDYQFYKDSLYNCEFTIIDGLLHGPYTSYYPNGHVKAKGEYKYNQRDGHWTLFDPDGKKLMVRDYDHMFEFERIYPPVPKKGPAALFNRPVYTVEKDSLNLIPYHEFF